MRRSSVSTLLLLMLSIGTSSCNRIGGATSLTATARASEVGAIPAAKVDFVKQIEPILKARCQPCHFNGGKVYEQLPFDRPETIRSLGTRMFSRIRDEDERKLIREFLSQP